MPVSRGPVHEDLVEDGRPRHDDYRERHLRVRVSEAPGIEAHIVLSIIIVITIIIIIISSSSSRIDIIISFSIII